MMLVAVLFIELDRIVLEAFETTVRKRKPRAKQARGLSLLTAFYAARLRLAGGLVPIAPATAGSARQWGGSGAFVAPDPHHHGRRLFRRLRFGEKVRHKLLYQPQDNQGILGMLWELCRQLNGMTAMQRFYLSHCESLNSTRHLLCGG
jgi:hypothetical protein